MRNKWWCIVLRIVGIVLMSMTAAFTLMGGAGTTCVALNPTGYGSGFAKIAPFQWLFILFVIIGIAIGVMGVRAVVMLVRGSQKAYRATMIALVAGTALNLIHVIVSRALRGASMPVDAVLYTNILTLAVFLLFRIPAIWQGINYEKPGGGGKAGKQAAAVALIAVGLLTLTIQFMMAPTHTVDGINYADAWHLSLTLIGSGLILSGIVTMLYKKVAVLRHEILVKAAK